MTSETSPVFNDTYTQAPTTITAARELKPTIARALCEVQNAAAVQTVRHAALNTTCTGFGRVCVFHGDCTSAPPRPTRTVWPKLNKAMPARMNTKSVEIVVLKPGRRTFIAEASIASAKNRAKRRRFSGFHRATTTVSTAVTTAADRCDVGFS